MGVGTMITGVAPAIGPTFGGVVVSTLSWRYIFVFLLPVLIIALILGITCIEQKAETSPAKIDQLSVGLIVLTFCGLIFGISNWGSQAFLSWSVAGALLVGGLALIGFSVRSLQIVAPIINLRLFKIPAFVQAVIAFVCLQVSALAMSFLLPNYIQLVNHNTALIAGLVVLPGAALGAIAGPMSGKWFDRVGAKLPLRTSAVVILIGTAGMWLCGQHLSNIVILGWYLLFMLGMGLGYGNLMTFGLNQLAMNMHTDGNAIFNTLQQFAAAVGTSMAAAIVAAGQKAADTQATGTVAGSVQSLMIVVILLVIELGCIWWVTQRAPQQKS